MPREELQCLTVTDFYDRVVAIVEKETMRMR